MRPHLRFPLPRALHNAVSSHHHENLTGLRSLSRQIKNLRKTWVKMVSGRDVWMKPGEMLEWLDVRSETASDAATQKAHREAQENGNGSPSEPGQEGNRWTRPHDHDSGSSKYIMCNAVGMG